MSMLYLCCIDYSETIIFFSLESEQFNTVLDAMFEFPAEPGQKIIAEGDDGDNFYVIENGVYDVYKVGHQNF